MNDFIYIEDVNGDRMVINLAHIVALLESENVLRLSDKSYIELSGDSMINKKFTSTLTSYMLTRAQAQAIIAAHELNEFPDINKEIALVEKYSPVLADAYRVLFRIAYGEKKDEYNAN